MRILGIDPGIERLGYGVIEVVNKKLYPITFGVITTPRKKTPYRISIIHRNLSKVIEEFSPDESSVEKLYFFQNTKTAIVVGEARGVILMTLEEYGLPIYEYTPLQIKSSVTGYGKAYKKQIQLMVQKLLKLDELPKQDDAADALAAALTHFYSRTILRLYND
jgi:crossover junction endodeoxyribonuclease RuvC